MDGNLDVDVFDAKERCSGFNTNKLDKSGENKDQNHQILDVIDVDREDNNQVDEVHIHCSLLT